MVAIGYLNSQIIWDFLYYQYSHTAKPSNLTTIPTTSYDYNEASRRLVNKPPGNNPMNMPIFTLFFTFPAPLNRAQKILPGRGWNGYTYCGISIPI
jgi:hypothetical protein